ncbi:hypothetical protein [Burkholderia ubonensis]|uniref:hypothetical protein n=1 Tax=Burkholderia ubonensis TaxID=101571 RepID=UPI0012FC1F73|nr:hypothetical protein [Burkholderia ubonensis]
MKQAHARKRRKKRHAAVRVACSSRPAWHRAKLTKPTFFLRFGAVLPTARCTAGMFQKRNAQARRARRMPSWRHPAWSSGTYPTQIDPVSRRPPRYRPIFSFTAPATGLSDI